MILTWTRVPMTFYTYETMAFPEFNLDTNAALNTKLVLTRPSFLKHVDCSEIITTSTRYKLGIYQAYKLHNLMKGDYLICVIGYQNNVLIPLSKLHSSCKSDTIQDIPVVTPSFPPIPTSIPSRSFRRVFEPTTMSGGYDDINASVGTRFEP